MKKHEPMTEERLLAIKAREGKATPDLLAEVERLRKEVKRLREENQKLNQSANWLAGMLETYEGCPHETRGDAFNRDAIPKICRCKEWDEEDESIECDEDGVKCWRAAARKATSKRGRK